MNLNRSQDARVEIGSREPLLYLELKVNHQESHIAVKDPQVCRTDCNNKACTYICPSFVYKWTDKDLEVFYQRCVECGACKLTCPNDNILLNYPAGGYGVVWDY